MIKINDLRKSYNGREALKGINLEVKAGEIFGLLGPNGAGKTTTIKILTGQLLADKGEANIFEQEVKENQEEILPKLGIVPENTNLYERLTIQQNLDFFGRLYDETLSQIKPYVKSLGLQEELDTQVKKLSKGMKQKVLILRALIHQPEVLIFDEPTAGLDPSSAEAVHNLLLKLNEKGLTILLTSHNMEEVDKLCDRIGFLSQGELITVGQPQDLKLRYSNNKVKIIYLPEDKEGLEEEIINLNTEVSGLKIAELIKANRLKAIHSLEPSLSDIFVHLTGRGLDNDQI
ncbi:MAG: ABC transporter ATP-binding protein [Bacillota bacterium]